MVGSWRNITYMLSKPLRFISQQETGTFVKFWIRDNELTIAVLKKVS